MTIKLRLLWRYGLTDANGILGKYEYKTDIIELPADSNAYQFPDVNSHGWLPELIGGEWINEQGE